ncbi:tyrosine-type recombinase/integrase [Brevibacillus formosus]|uniref:tyrosine-type recombinase/integrase n=1 Tax=Brevibacillus formosus TaxID=54913 RepID=UPI003F52DB56
MSKVGEIKLLYKVQKVDLLTMVGEVLRRYHIIKNNMPVYRVNVFLDDVGRNSENTGKQYAYRLCKFFQFLEDKRGKSYKQVKKADVMRFIDSLLFGSESAFYLDKGRVTYGTARHYLTVIKEFYRFLEDEMNVESNIVFERIKSKNSKNSYLYGRIWDLDISTVLSKRVSRTKSSKEHIKWYTEEEKEAIKENFGTLRDKAIFLLTLQGMRIDEVLSLRIFDYDSENMEVSLYASKGKERGNVGSVVVIPMETAKTIDDYLFNERDQALNRLQEKNSEWEFPQELFINLRSGENLCKPVSYRNYLCILKNAAKSAGLNPARIRTHSGRSTKTMELLHYQITHPEDNLTDEHIRQLMRWSNANSITPYINYQDKKLAIESAKKIHNRIQGDLKDEQDKNNH